MKTKQTVTLVIAPCLLGLAWVELSPTCLSSGAARGTSDGVANRHPSGDAITISPPARRRQTRSCKSSRELEVPPRSQPDGRWLGANPAEAIVIADSMEPGKLRDRLLLRTIQEWTSESPQDARAWCARHANPDERARLLEVIENAENGCDALAENRQPTVDQLAYAVSLVAGDESKRVQVESLAEKWAGEDFKSARDWALCQPEGEIRDALIHRIAMVQVENDPAEAARLVAEEIPPGTQQDEAVMSVVHLWAIQDSVAVAAWVKAFPDGALRSRAQQELQGLAAYQAGIDVAPRAR